MDGPIIVVMVKIVRVRSFVRRAERCQRLRSAHLQGKALQRQANQQQNAQELAHGDISQTKWVRLYQHAILMVVPVVNVPEMRMAVPQDRMYMVVDVRFRSVQIEVMVMLVMLVMTVPMLMRQRFVSVVVSMGLS